MKNHQRFDVKVFHGAGLEFYSQVKQEILLRHQASLSLVDGWGLSRFWTVILSNTVDSETLEGEVPKSATDGNGVKREWSKI